MAQALASRYAQALADAVLAPGSDLHPDAALEQLRLFETMLRTVPELRTVMESPAVSPVKKKAAIGRLAEAVPFSRLVRNFLVVLIDRRRPDLLDEIADAFEAAVDERMGFVRAKVMSAVPLDAAQQERLRQSLSEVTGKNVRCIFETDPELISGVVARIGSKVYDGSVRSQLDAMRQRLAATQ